MIIDIEGKSTNLPYDIGYIICDKYGKIYKKESFCILSNLLTYRRNPNVDKKIDLIIDDSEKLEICRTWEIVSTLEFKNKFCNDLKEFKIKYLYSFNNGFDKAMLKKIFTTEFEDLSIVFRDIKLAILQTKLLKRKYIDYCYQNNYVTRGGYVSTTVETIYRYLFNNQDFKEKHIAIEDVFAEYKILMNAFRAKKKIKWENKNAWKELNDLAIKINYPYAVR